LPAVCTRGTESEQAFEPATRQQGVGVHSMCSGVLSHQKHVLDMGQTRLP
jgi:hypothetical protein